jgi:hypothetical protein
MDPKKIKIPTQKKMTEEDRIKEMLLHDEIIEDRKKEFKPKPFMTDEEFAELTFQYTGLLPSDFQKFKRKSSE